MLRLRIRFCRGDEVKFISHLDIMRLWHRALNRAGMPLAYSEGFNPHPRLSLAAPLALGITSEAELVDVYTQAPMSPHAFIAMVTPHLPAGLEVSQVSLVSPALPSLQSQLRFAEYEVRLPAESEAQVSLAIASLMEKKSLPWSHQRDTGMRCYDLRPLIDALWLIGYEDGIARITMRLRCDASGAGRPEQVARALGLNAPLEIRRTKLILKAG